MPVYALAQLSIHDRSRYDRYVAQFMPVLAGFDGKLLAADESVAVLEGAWSGDKVVLLEFPDQAAFADWALSPEYVEIAKDRVAATDGSVLLVHGLPVAASDDTEPCDECGFVYDLEGAEGAADLIVAAAGELSALLAGGAAVGVRDRPAPETWSPLEYGCHVRDVLLVQRERVLAARRVTTPAFEPMGRDERVEHDGYAEQEPADVARQLTDAALLFAGVLRRLGPGDWARTMVYSYPTRMERSLRWVAVHTLHEVRHHLLDARRSS